MKFTKVIGIAILVVIILLIVIEKYLNNGSKNPDNKVWQSYIGRDTTVGILPDYYANYFTYTIARTRRDIGLRIRGKYPDTRYFSFNVYSLGDNATQGSIVDYQILSDSGLPSPFVAFKDSTETGENYTVHIIPNKYQDLDLTNKLTFRNDVKLLAIVMRLYDYNIDDTGGVSLPTVEALDLDENKNQIKSSRLPKALDLRKIVRTFSLPKMVKRLSLLYNTENTIALDMNEHEQPDYTIPFHGVDDSGFIENNDNRYLMSAITKETDEVYIFNFKAPSFTTGPENINVSDVRYWSFNLGNAASYNFNALKDEDANVDDQGNVNIVMSGYDTEIINRANQLGYNFLEWNMPHRKGLILFRHMLADEDFEAQIEDVPPLTESTTDYPSIEAFQYMGDYAPRGIRMTKSKFLETYQVVNQADGHQETL